MSIQAVKTHIFILSSFYTSYKKAKSDVMKEIKILKWSPSKEVFFKVGFNQKLET
jgi:hypothetical protein